MTKGQIVYQWFKEYVGKYGDTYEEEAFKVQNMALDFLDQLGEQMQTALTHQLYISGAIDEEEL